MKNQIKYMQNLFYDLLNDYGSAYVVVKYSDNTSVGRRGFSEEEKKKGLILVFNRKNYRDLQWTEDGSIIATLGFGAGNRPEKCFLHSDDIVSVFSPDAGVKLDRWDILKVRDNDVKSEEPMKTEGENMQEEKIVSLDTFRKTKK